MLLLVGCWTHTHTYIASYGSIANGSIANFKVSMCDDVINFYRLAIGNSSQEEIYTGFYSHLTYDYI